MNNIPSSKPTSRFCMGFACLLMQAALIFASNSLAQTVPPMVNYQGRLVNSNGAPLTTGDYDLAFSIHDAPTGGAQVWGPQVFDGVVAPGHGARVPVVQGHFNVILGPSDTNGAAIRDAFNGPTRYLEIRVGTNLPILPRQQVLSAPYAFRSDTAAKADAAMTLLGAATTQTLNYYVATNGLDTNDGLTTNTPKRTIQAAVDLVPSQLKHHIYIRIFPGVYREFVQIIRKQLFDPNASLQLIGMGTNASAVRVSGADILGNRTRPMSLYVYQADGYAINMTFEECTDSCVQIVDRSEFTFIQCNFWGFPGEMAVQRYSSASFENCYFERFGASGNAGLTMETMSYCGFRNDHAFSPGSFDIPGFVGDPSNSLINTFKNFTQGIRARGGSIVVTTGALNFMNVTTPSATIEGGQVF